MTRGNIIAWAKVAATALALSGCATAIKGTTQTISVGSKPDGAECSFAVEGQPIGKVTTPGPIIVPRSRKPINVLCTKDGYEEARATLHSKTQRPGPSLIGFDGLVDLASGALNDYQPAVMLELTSLSPADAAAAAARPKPAPTAAPPVQPGASAPMTYGPGMWQAQMVPVTVLSSYVVGNCGKEEVIYSLDVTDNKLTADSAGRRVFTIAIPADGTIKHTFRSPTGASWGIAGNVRPRDLEVVNPGFGCPWTLRPI